MILFKWLFLLLPIPTLGGLKELQRFDNDSANERIMKTVFEYCYRDDYSSNPIVISGDFGKFIDGPNAPVIRMSNALNTDDDGKPDLLSFQGRHFVILEESMEQLKSDLTLVRETKWWNHMGQFYIVGKHGKTCGNFKEILITAWKMDIINAIYICSESTNASSLYTMNPIANFAPNPWKIINLDDVNVFRQAFDPKVSCQNLHYDKTRVLNGYGIRVVAARAPGLIDLPGGDASLETSQRLELRIIRATIAGLNASLLLEIGAGFDREIERVASGASDLTLDVWPYEQYSEIPSLSPYFPGEMIAVVKSNPEASTLYKIIHLWSPPVLYLAFIVLALLFTVLAMKNSDESSALLDLIRFLTYVSIRTNSRSNSFRIYFTTMLIFIVISNGVFQGKIAAFLTTREKIRAAGTIDELIALRYKFYAGLGYASFVKSHCAKCDLTEVQSVFCIDHLLNTTAHSCFIMKDDYRENFALLPLESIEKPLVNTLVNHKCRHNWPLRDRVDDMWVRIIRAGLLDFWRMEKSKMLKRQSEDIELSLPRYRPVKLAKLDFAFQLLTIGLALSTIVFALELLHAKYGTD